MPSMETKDAETRAQPNPLRSCYAFTLVDVVSDLHLRLATVAGGFSILKDREDENDDADHFVSECRHHWGLTDGKEGKLEACGTISAMSESAGGEQLCLETDPDGDVVLRFSKPECNVSISFCVSSKILRLASPVFVRMLSPTFKEGHAFLHVDRVVIELKDNDPSLMELTLSILHHQADIGEHLANAKNLARLAIHCDEYDCIEASSPWAAAWFTKLEESKAFRPLYGFQLLAAYLFNNPSNFLKISKAAVSTLEPSCPAQWSQEEILALLPESVSNAVTENIESILDLMKDELQNAESRIREFHRCYEMAHLLCISCG
ncbi:hypothetical protein ST47_g2200 [Ascochyta rabiei]|uniref:BTB domain-containing protein n=1 Tax=Didymella rabiei TaxID=5454 RepID=A0A163JXQ5_DIDRA|nr:hypothetical protein ST47_g2200 [Ascochyta rabiei]